MSTATTKRGKLREVKRVKPREEQGRAAMTFPERFTVTGEGFLYDLATGESFTLNESGICVVRALLDGRRAEQVWRDLVRDFDVTPDDARRDAAAFLAQLVDLHVIERPA